SELKVIPTRQRIMQMLAGMASWLLPALAGSVVLFASGIVKIEKWPSLGELVSTTVILFILVFIYEAFTEELLFRGYIFAKLQKIFSPKATILIQAVLFTLWGFFNGGENSIDRTL